MTAAMMVREFMIDSYGLRVKAFCVTLLSQHFGNDEDHEGAAESSAEEEID
jgi:hypothetical protein